MLADSASGRDPADAVKQFSKEALAKPSWRFAEEALLNRTVFC